jgi:hypothetical protein
MLRFLYSLIALALVLSPLGMLQGGMAMAHGPAAEMAMAEGHCGDSQAPADKGEGSKAMLDCMGICSAIAAGDEPSTARAALPGAVNEASALAALSGLSPESEPPPPRIS